MEYALKDISKNPAIQKILEILSKNIDNQTTVSMINAIVQDSPHSAEIKEINIYVGDFENNIIDKDKLIQEIIRVSSEQKKNEA